MSARSTRKKSERAETRSRYARFHAMRDEDIDYSDIPATTKKFWKNAQWVQFIKTPISIHIDEDVMRWFKHQGPGYQSRMNRILRAYMEHQSRKSKKKRSR